MSFFKPRQSNAAASNASSGENQPFFKPLVKLRTEEQGANQDRASINEAGKSIFGNHVPFFKPPPKLRQKPAQDVDENASKGNSGKVVSSSNQAVIQKKEGAAQDQEAGTENVLEEESTSVSVNQTQESEANLNEGTNPGEPEITAPSGPYWKHEWQTDRFGREALFIWEVGGKRWHSNADRGYAYIREMAAKSPDENGYDPRFERYKHRPQAKEGKHPELDFWFKKTPGWDDKTKADDGTADFQDLAEFSDVSHNKRRTGFYKMAFVFDPKIYEKLEAIKTQKENSEFIGTTTNYKAYVSAPNGIILHKTPTPNDAQYAQRQASKNAAFILATNTPLFVLGEGNEQNEGWVYVRSQSGETGWIERHFTGKKPSAESLSSFDSYTVKKGDKLENLIKSYYGKYPIETGDDRRTIALAIYTYNKGRTGSGVYRDHAAYVKSRKENAMKDAIDVWMVETRSNYASVKLYEGGEVYLPPADYIQEMRKKGELEKRPDFVDTLVDSAQVLRGFGDGVNIGFLDAIVETGTDLYNMVVDIFTGEFFKQIAEIYKLFMDNGFSGVWQMLKDAVVGTWEEVKAAWNNPNAYERGKYFGEIVGAILLEVVIAVLTYGIGTAIKQSARLAKFISWFPSLKKLKKLPDGEMDRYAGDIKKVDGRKELNEYKSSSNEVEKTARDNTNILESNKIEIPETGKKIENEVNNTKRKELVEAAEVEMDNDPNWKKEKGNDQYAKKLAALATAKIITEGADLIGLPITVLKSELSFLKTLPEVKEFEFDGGNGVYKVYMIGSKFLVDGKYTESGDGKYYILGKSKNGIVLQQGDNSFGWVHIVRGHVDGRPGKSRTMFPHGLSKGKIKELILEACDIGVQGVTQGDRVFLIAKFNPSKYGVSEIEMYINKVEGNIIETAYPTKGTGVWENNKK